MRRELSVDIFQRWLCKMLKGSRTLQENCRFKAFLSVGIFSIGDTFDLVFLTCKKLVGYKYLPLVTSLKAGPCVQLLFGAETPLQMLFLCDVAKFHSAIKLKPSSL